MRLSLLFILISLCALSIACGRRPAYSDIQSNQSSSNQNQAQPAPNPVAEEAAKAEQPPALGQSPAAGAQPQSSPSAQAPAFRIPAFFDTTKGQIKDLPSYPKGQVSNMQYGPINGVDSAMLVLQVREPLEKIAAFYESAIKANGWTVAKNVRDPDNYNWQLVKGDLHEGMVDIRKDPQTNLSTVIISRAERPPEKKP